MVAKKSTNESTEPENEIAEVKEFDPKTFKMEPFDKNYIVIETAYDTYKLARPRGPKTGRNHLRLIQKWSSKITYDESMIVARNEVITALVEKAKMLPEAAASLMMKCGLVEPADEQQLELEQERKLKAEEEWFDTVLPDILKDSGKTVDDIPAEDFKPIFESLYYGVKVRPDYFRIIQS